MTEQDRDDIERRAYERFVKRGMEHGHDEEDWFEAERETRDRRGTGQSSAGNRPSRPESDRPQSGS